MTNFSRTFTNELGNRITIIVGDEQLDHDAVCTTCRWKGTHGPKCPDAARPWPTIKLDAGQVFVGMYGPHSSHTNVITTMEAKEMWSLLDTYLNPRTAELVERVRNTDDSPEANKQVIAENEAFQAQCRAVSDIDRIAAASVKADKDMRARLKARAQGEQEARAYVVPPPIADLIKHDGSPAMAAFRQGRKDFINNVNVNPHQPSSRVGVAWQSGWSNMEKVNKQFGGKRCKAGQDGECNWASCPQTRDHEPENTGRHCPLDVIQEQE